MVAAGQPNTYKTSIVRIKMQSEEKKIDIN